MTATETVPEVVVVTGKKKEDKEKEDVVEERRDDSKAPAECRDNAVVLEVEVQPGQQRRLTVSQDDNAEDVVRAFAKTHALTEAATDELLRRVFESLHDM